MSRPVEGLAAEPPRGRANGLKELSLWSKLPYDVMLGVGTVDGIVGADGDAVGATKDSLSPGGQEVPIAVKDDNRVLAASVCVDTAFGVHHRAGAVSQEKSIGEFGPSFHYFVGQATTAQGCRHIDSTSLPISGQAILGPWVSPVNLRARSQRSPALLIVLKSWHVHLTHISVHLRDKPGR